MAVRSPASAQSPCLLLLPYPGGSRAHVESLQLFLEKPVPACWSPTPSSAHCPSQRPDMLQATPQRMRKGSWGVPAGKMPALYALSQVHTSSHFSPRLAQELRWPSWEVYLSNMPLRHAFPMFLSLLKVEQTRTQICPFRLEGPSGICHHHLPWGEGITFHKSTDRQVPHHPHYSASMSFYLGPESRGSPSFLKTQGLPHF